MNEPACCNADEHNEQKGRHAGQSVEGRYTGGDVVATQADQCDYGQFA